MEVFVGTVCAFGFNFAPYGWFECYGQIMPISAYPALYALLGTFYGGNGTSTFGLPNLQGVAVKGQGQGSGLANYIIGHGGGVQTTSLTVASMPLHSHTLTIGMAVDAQGNNGNTGNPNGACLATSNINAYASSSNGNLKVSATGNTEVTDSTGAGTPFSIQAPFQVLNYCICNDGYFPSRN